LKAIELFPAVRAREQTLEEAAEAHLVLVPGD